MELGKDLSYKEYEVEPAKLSVLAETAKVTLYYFDLKNYKFLPEEVKQTLQRAARNDKDFDDRDIEEIEKRGREWDKQKEDIYMKVISQQYHSRRVDDFKMF